MHTNSLPVMYSVADVDLLDNEPSAKHKQVSEISSLSRMLALYDECM